MNMFMDKSVFEDAIRRRIDVAMPGIDLLRDIKVDGPLFINSKVEVSTVKDNIYFSVKDPIKLGQTYYKVTFQSDAHGKISLLNVFTAFTCRRATPETTSKVYELVVEYLSTTDFSALIKASLEERKRILTEDIHEIQDKEYDYYAAMEKAYNDCLELMEKEFYGLKRSTNLQFNKKRDAAKTLLKSINKDISSLSKKKK